MGTNPDSGRADGANPARSPHDEMPRWVKIFGIAAAVAVAVFAFHHVALGGMGHYMNGQASEHSRHLP